MSARAASRLSTPSAWGAPAPEVGGPSIAPGLSRGRMFETRLTPDLLRDGRHGADEIDDAVLAARKVYHRVDDEVSRSLDVSLFRDDRIFEEVRFVDFYRYCDAGLEEVLAHLERAVPWARPSDTGRSTNCLINDVGIWVHQRERGFHNYALPYSWDVRLGHKRREEALAELDDDIDPDHVRRILDEIGYAPPASPSESVDDASFLTAFYVASDDIPEAELRAALEEKLPAPLVPRVYRRLEALPLTAAGKVDEAALLAIAPAGPARPVRPPEGPVERYLVEVWEEQLAAGPIDTEADFFALGGTSLRAMEVMIRLCRDFDVDLPLDTLMRHPTVRRLAGVVEERILADVAALGGHGPARDPAEPGAGPS